MAWKTVAGEAGEEEEEEGEAQKYPDTQRWPSLLLIPTLLKLRHDNLMFHNAVKHAVSNYKVQVLLWAHELAHEG